VSDSPRESARTLAGSTSGTIKQQEHTPLLIDAKAAAALLAISPRKLWTLTRCNAIPSRRIGRAVRYCPTELRLWVVAGCPTEPGAAERVRRWPTTRSGSGVSR